MASIDIDIDEIIYAMSSYEKQELADEHIDDDWNEQVNKLFNNKWRLTKEDEETILRITNKLV
jgi:hypothetical protein